MLSLLLAIFHIVPENALIDQEVEIKLEQVKPSQIVRIEAETIDDDQVKWRSYGVFQANASGVINLNEIYPIQGSYDDKDSMGLFWSMRPEEQGNSFKRKNDEFSIVFKAFSEEKEELAAAQVTRICQAHDVEKIVIHEDGVDGWLFLPKGDKKLPVIVTLSGSNGGYSANRAKLFASHGFAAFALAYFGVKGLPTVLQEIPLEYFEKAFAVIKKHPRVDGNRLGLYGVSRGAELTLILGSIFPDEMHAIVAVAPSSAVQGGLCEHTGDAWQYKGKSIAPNAPIFPTDFNDGKGMAPSNPVRACERFIEGMKDTKGYEKAQIAVENIRCPFLFVSGGDDGIWPSDLFAEQIIARLQEKHATTRYTHLHYQKAGHAIGVPHLPSLEPAYYHPVRKYWQTLGGTPRDDQEASRDSWKKIVIFFKDNL